MNRGLVGQSADPRQGERLPLGEQPDLRVIVVGRTGLEVSLRRDPRIELVRARTALQAIGELSDPLDATSPRTAVVVVGADADPGPEADRFITAVHLVDPATRVLLVNEAGTAPPATTRYDGIISSETSPDAVRSIALSPLPSRHRPAAAHTIHNAPPPPPPASSSAAFTEPKPAPAPSVPAVAAGHDDLRLLQAALAGRDIVSAALDVLRARSGDEALTFTPGEAGPSTLAAGMAPVRHRDRLFGHLFSSTLSPAALQGHSEWLAYWLALSQQQTELRRAALVDDLTGAWNRRYFDRYMQTALERAARERQTLSILLFDIDDFKYFNDKYGHSAGDEILKQTVSLLQSVIRTSDRVCRIGGDEFAVIYYEPAGPRDPSSKPPDTVWQLASRFQKQISEARFPKLGNEAPGRLTVSGGLATYPWDGRTVEELLEHADKLAMQSKSLGKDKIIMGPDTSEQRSL